MRRRAAASATMLALALTGVALLTPVALAAQPVSLTGTPVEVQVWPGGELGSTLFIVTGHIPEGTPLPAMVRLPLPAGSEVVWSGEILGGPVGEDPQREHTIVEATGGQALEMTAESTRTVQYEAVGPALSVIDGMTTSVFEWVQTVPTGDVVFSVRIPASAGSVEIDPMPVGSPRTNDAGERLYTLRPAVLSEGQSFTVTAAFGPPGAGGSNGSGFPLLWGLVGALVVAAAALPLVVARQRRMSA
ncbi:MAG: hypothetical protein RQ731_00145 [Anaerosomatales bacterium]|nr:hypothetical protein [Anaerosomatales bacterium]MDT8433163.1 hypothetical protein [Anaerosomatales bacterium]